MWYGSRVSRHGRSRPCAGTRRAAGGGTTRRSGGGGDGQRALASGTGRDSARIIVADREDLHEDRRCRRDGALRRHARVSKADPRVDAYGEVDELNAWLGVARAAGLDADDRRAARRNPARSVRARRAAGRSAHKIATRVDEGRASRRDDVDAARAADRPARDRAAAAAPVHSCRADRRPARCCTWRAPSAAAPSATSSRSAPDAVDPVRRSSTSTGCPTCCSSWRARPTIAPACRKSSGSGHAPTRAACDMARQHYENFPVASRLLPRAHTAAHRGHLRFCAHCRRFRGRGHAARRDARLALARRLAANRLHGRSRGPPRGRTIPTPAAIFRGAWRHDSPIRSATCRCSTICSARSGRT